MTKLKVAGGVYHERCSEPLWDHLYGSGGRAASAIATMIDEVELHTYIRDDVARDFELVAQNFGFKLVSCLSSQIVTFDYFHPLSEPKTIPAFDRIVPVDPFYVEGEAILRFGMLEGTAKVKAKRCVYDPQCPLGPEKFEENGSSADHLAIVANVTEVLALGSASDYRTAASNLLDSGASIVIVKAGVEGAYLFEQSGSVHIPPYHSDKVWTIGSGDVFSAVFAAQWAVNEVEPRLAADVASRCVAEYAETMSLPISHSMSNSIQGRIPLKFVPLKVYLAGPFFNIAQKWIIEETRNCLLGFGLQVFSPFHDVGIGKDSSIAAKDIDGLNDSDVVLGLLDGLDPGTIFEIGYARARGIPVYVLAQSVSEDDMVMIRGSGCTILEDFSTAIHRVAWKS